MRREDEGEVIERVLTGLRTAESPAGMERRIAEAIHAHASADGTRPEPRGQLEQLSSRVREDVFGLRAGLTAAAGLAVVFAGIVAMRVHSRPVQDMARPASVVVVAERGEKPREMASVLPHDPARRIVTRQRRVAPPVLKQISIGRVAGNVSYPAPVAPLSAQERALLAVARTGGPQEIAMLDPVARAKRNAEDEAEFERFAGQAAKADHE